MAARDGRGRRARRWALRLALAGALAFVVGSVGLRVAARAVDLPSGFLSSGSQVVTFADGTFAHVFLSSDEKWRIGVRLDEVDPAYVEALLALEDQRFYAHGGVDWIAVVRAAITNVRRGRVVSGASTITMQLVRVREPRPRTLTSKVKEVFRAAQVEARYSKDQILAAYLEYVPYGRNVEGIEAAALSYFGHRATALAPEEISTLLAVPQNPNARYPTPAHAGRLRAARNDIARRLHAEGALGLEDAAALARLEDSPVPRRLTRFPRLVPHAAYWLRARNPSPARIHTTLDRGIQQQAEAVLRDARASLAARGVEHGAVVVVEHDSGAVRALVGSPGFWGGDPGQQIASFAVPRSPGSALKPFIYGLGIDQGSVLPEHLVLDVPISYGTYVPKNYDGRFTGLVRARDALSKSLNVPFVNLLSEVGVDRFIGHLHAWGVSSLQDEPGFYGLSAAIGGLELSPLDLAGLYAMIARGGRFHPLELRVDAETKRGEVPGLSAGAAYLVQDALRIKDRPDFPARRRFTGAPPHIHWKTGTSYGHRDAWAAGSDLQHTAVVWLGNLDQRPSANLVGAEAAGPLLFDVLEGLGADRPEDLPGPPKDLTRVEVCRYSGHAPGPGCAHTSWVWARRTAVPTAPCPYHVALDVDDATGLAIAPRCRSSRPHHTERFLVWPSSLRRWLSDGARHAPSPPAYLEGCEGVATAAPPRILSPGSGQLALLIPGVPAGDQEIPLAAESGSHQLSWFVDGEYLGTVASEQRLWWPPRPGRHTVVVTDDAGRSAEQVLRVERSLGQSGGEAP